MSDLRPPTSDPRPPTPDQADKLRILVQSTAEEDTDRHPTLVVVAGGRPGVGVTTVATELAIGLCRRDHRVTLVDADPVNPSLARRYDLVVDSSIDDVFSGNRTVQEVLGQGPAGVQILPGSKAPREHEITPAAQKKLLEGIRRIGSATDLAVVDVGNLVSPSSVRFWDAADLVLLVTTPEADAILGAYGAVKLAADLDRLPPIVTVVTRAAESQIAIDVQSRLATACQRFLNRTIQNSAPVDIGTDGSNNATAQPNADAFVAGSEKLSAQFIQFVEMSASRQPLAPELQTQVAAA